METYLAHHGILGQKWGVRRFQNPDGTLTPAGQKRYAKEEARQEANRKYVRETLSKTGNNSAAAESIIKSERNVGYAKEALTGLVAAPLAGSLGGGIVSGIGAATWASAHTAVGTIIGSGLTLTGALASSAIPIGGAIVAAYGAYKITKNTRDRIAMLSEEAKKAGKRG